uniref:Uncharacterized protein n=1 Tax=Kuetzingia canaliculata TaxID=228262 RepID=A0A1Z1MPH0_KUECA|nr:hypothetical protein [Kuetzingia canaliculata]ARW67948.1 hypothetical protein [Kuetzingia canaliculata]
MNVTSFLLHKQPLIEIINWHLFRFKKVHTICFFISLM